MATTKLDHPDRRYRFDARQRAAGLARTNVWVPAEDVPRIKAVAAALREAHRRLTESDSSTARKTPEKSG